MKKLRAYALRGSLALLTAACSSTPDTREPLIPDPPTTGTAARADAAPYEVHEWGLVRADTGDVLNAGAIAPPGYYAMDVDKPVLYFHANAPITLRSVRVRTPRGDIVEHWPLSVSGITSDLTWPNVALDPHGECILSILPTHLGEPCSFLPPGMECESTGLAALRLDDVACVTAPRASERFLFYRARTKAFTPPLRFTRSDGDVVEVENDSDAKIPGVLVRIWSDGNVNHSMMALPPGPRAKILVGHEAVGVDAPSDKSPRASSPFSGAGPEALRMSLSELGMTTSETDSFMGAWSEALFASYRGYDDESLDGDGRRMPADSFVYFLPVAMIDAIAKLDFDPPPRAVKRAFAVWSPVRAKGSGR